MTAANDNGTPAAPRSLKLEFSRAADYGRINALFDPAQKQAIDPHGYVVKRLEPYFRAAIDGAGAAMLSDENNNVTALTIAYRVNHPADTNAPRTHARHDVTEFGTSLARLPGYNAARLVVAALTLREFMHHTPNDAMIAEIKRSNVASRKTYVDYLGWREMLDVKKARRMYDATDITLVNDADKGAGKNIKDLSKADSLWHYVDLTTLRVAASTLLDAINQGGLVNKATGHKMPVDFSALAQHGLTNTVLTAIATGRPLHKIVPPAP